MTRMKTVVLGALSALILSAAPAVAQELIIGDFYT